MQITHKQKTVSGTKFVIDTNVKPPDQRVHYSDMTKREIQLSKDLQQLTPEYKPYKLILDLIDYGQNTLNIKLVKYGKQIADTTIDFLTKNPLDELSGKKLEQIFNTLKNNL